MLSVESGAALSGFFYVTGRCARIAVRGGGYAGLVAARAAAGRGPLRPATTDSGGSGILELFAHAIELRRVLGAEPAPLLGRTVTMASTPTTHRRTSLAERWQALSGFFVLGGVLRVRLRSLMRAPPGAMRGAGTCALLRAARL